MHTESSEKLVKLMTRPSGRAGRFFQGLPILGLGRFVVRGTPGLVVSLISLVPNSGAVFGFCLIARGPGYPLMRSSAEGRRSTMDINKDTRVADILREYGDIAEVMEVFGVRRVGRYSVRAMAAKAVSVEWAARIHRVPLDEFLRILREAVALQKAGSAGSTGAS